MPKSLLEQLPEIVAQGRKEAEKILEGLEGRFRVSLQTREVVLPARASATTDWVQHQARQEQHAGSGAAWTNRLVYGDNLLAMAALLAGDAHSPSLRGKVDLIYIDPPFDSKADYRTKVALPGLELEQRPTVIEQFAYSDTWSDGTASYLAMITPRLILMRELLADTGSIYVHLDWHVGHYVKLVMDEVFGKDNFVNEICWWYKRWSAAASTFQRMHDTIYFYRKSDKYKFNQLFQPLAASTAAVHGNTRRVNLPDDSGRLVTVRTEEPSRGVQMHDVWEVPFVVAHSQEQVGYGTQKPIELVARILEASSDPGDLVADFFGGSGSFAAAAEGRRVAKDGNKSVYSTAAARRWITTDLGKPACMIMRKRLIDQDAQPFLYQAIGDYQLEAAKATLGRDFRMGDLSQIVLSLYGAMPLPAEVNPQRNLGQIAGFEFGGRRGSKTLVLADSPNKLTGMATLKKAIAQRDNLLGGWDRVVVLGWNFEPSIGETITALNDSRLEVLVIPPDLMDRLKKKGGIDKLRGQVRFSSLQYLTIHPVVRQASPSPAGADGAGEETLTVQLKNYVLLSPEAINLDDANRTRLQQIANAQPLALIEYWAVDPDYDGKVFRSVWQDYRGNTASDGDALHVVTAAVVTTPAKAGPRKVCVRVVDVFGFEAEVVATVGAAAP
ncbi:DNA methyltransferase [Acidovorax sp. sic0104]|uniref:DNA methyltransferase n=1 Tax=Acidovorax sp. sic0104 TaxID=2854784 RepID=UPI001C48E762|nr:site-specific DNA-methyltransferase [Acidovorax sp. sic0104]MBV7542272.1 site-specific DNA-methyltransferase [Acidovorax sp. sic0104]